MHHHGEFVVQAEAWEAERIHGVGSSHDWYSGAKHSAEDVLVSGENTASKLILLVGPDAEPCDWMRSCQRSREFLPM
jgi:hypothetical protein